MLCYVDGMKKGVDSKGEVMHKNATSKLHSRCVYPYPLLPPFGLRNAETLAI